MSLDGGGGAPWGRLATAIYLPTAVSFIGFGAIIPLVPLTAGAAKMSYGVFTLFNVIGAVVWSTVLVLLGYFLGQFAIIQKLIEPIFILIAVLSALPIFFEWRKRRRAEKSKPAETDVSQENVE